MIYSIFCAKHITNTPLKIKKIKLCAGMAFLPPTEAGK